MNPHVRSLSAALALGIVAVAYFVFQARMDRPGPPRPAARALRRAPGRVASRPAHGARHPGSEGCPGPQRGPDRSPQGLDRLWTHEMSGLTAMIRRGGAGVLRLRERRPGGQEGEPPGDPTAVGGVEPAERGAEGAPPASLRRGVARAGRVAAPAAGPVEGAGHREGSDEPRTN